MTITAGSFSRDANSIPIWTDGIIVTKSMTFAGATLNDPGDFDGTGNPATLFTVTGDVIVNIFAMCTTLLVGATATLEVGITGNLAALIAQTTGSNIHAGYIWATTSPATVLALPAANLLTNSTNIIQTVGTADLTAGVLTYYCAWRPLSTNGNVVAA